MKRFFIFTFIGLMLCMSTILVSPDRVQANTYQSFILSNEGGGLISELTAAGYGNYNLYQTLIAIQQSTTPTTAGVITDQFLAELAACPASSEIFSIPLIQYTSPAGEAFAISTNGTVQVVNIFGSTYYGQPGITTLSSNISGVGTALFTYSTTGSPLISWTGGVVTNAVTYNAFAVGWMPASVPEPGTLLLLGTGLIGMVGLGRKKLLKR